MTTIDLVARAVAAYEAKQEAISQMDVQDTSEMVKKYTLTIAALTHTMTSAEFRKFIAYID